MKQSPDLALAQARMAPGIVTMDGFLGSDPRDLIEILQDDDGCVRRLGLTHEKIASAMRALTEQAVATFGAPIQIGHYRASACEVMGEMPCPFGHPGLYYKTVVEVERLDRRERMMWSALLVHMVGEHGFYEGRGSPFRLEPEQLARFLGLLSETGSGNEAPR